MASIIRLIAVTSDFGDDGQTAWRRCGDGRDIAEVVERQVERAGNGSGGEGEDVDMTADLFEFFLLLHAEPLFLVDDDKTEVEELDVVL